MKGISNDGRKVVGATEPGRGKYTFAPTAAGSPADTYDHYEWTVDGPGQFTLETMVKQ